MAEPVRVGMIGLGGIGRHHLQNLRADPRAAVVALCDVNEAAVRAVNDGQDAAIYTDYRAMLDAEQLDAVYVSIPPAAHTDQVILAAERGLAVFVEKPVTLTMDKALEVEESIKRAGVLSAAGYTMRYWPGLCAAREYLAGRTVSMVSCHRWGGYPPEGHWWRRMEISGGQMHEQMTHQIDGIRWTCGEFRAVWARYESRTQRQLPHFTVPTSYAASFELAGGAVGTMSCSCALPDGGGAGPWTVLLEGERVEINPHDGARRYPADEALDLTMPQMSIDEGFIAAVATGDGSTIRSSYSDAVVSLEVSLACNESAATSKPVECRRWRDREA